MQIALPAQKGVGFSLNLAGNDDFVLFCGSQSQINSSSRTRVGLTNPLYGELMKGSLPYSDAVLNILCKYNPSATSGSTSMNSSVNATVLKFETVLLYRSCHSDWSWLINGARGEAVIKCDQFSGIPPSLLARNYNRGTNNP